jgi:transcriptional regulator with XRE-family HTH domain
VFLMTSPEISRLRAVRLAQNKTLRAVARQAKVDAAYLSKVERGLQRPSVDFLFAVSRVLGLKNVTDALSAVLIAGTSPAGARRGAGRIHRARGERR